MVHVTAGDYQAVQSMQLQGMLSVDFSQEKQALPGEGRWILEL